MEVIILAGGLGSRMESSYPKPLFKLKDKPILGYQLDYFLSSDQINRVILALGKRAGEIIDFIQDNYTQALIDFSIEKEPLGTGGAIKLAMTKASSDFVLVLNCDDLTDIDLNKLSQIKENTICVANPRLPFAIINEKDGYAQYEEKPLLKDMWVSIGWYVLDRQKLLEIIPDKSSIEYDVFPKLNCRLYKHTGFWQPINTKKDVTEFESRELPQIFKNGPHT